MAGIQGIGGMAGGASAVERQPHIIRELELMQGSIRFLDEQINKLEGRIEPIMRGPSPDLGNKTIDKELDIIASLASNIREHRLTVERVTRRLNFLLERIEL